MSRYLVRAKGEKPLVQRRTEGVRERLLEAVALYEQTFAINR
jgi:hypothetical protein